jgi:hypothetical protein
MLLSLGGMFLALGVVILAVRIGGSAMRLRCGFVMFRRFVVFVLHVVFLIVGRRISVHTPMSSIVAAPSANGVFSELLRTELPIVMTLTRLHAGISQHR